MIEEIKDNENILFISKNDLNIQNDFIYTFDNVIVIDNNKDSINLLNQKNINKIYLLGHDDFFRYMLPRLKKEIEVCWIFKNSFSDLSNIGTRYTLHSIFEYLDRKLINSIGCLSKDNYDIFTNAGYNCELINVITKNNKKEVLNSNTIGILSNDFDPNNNFYNQLGALTMVDYDYVKFNYVMRATKHFIKDFNIKYEKVNTFDDVISNNFVNLYINFTNTNDILIIKSFNKGVPCIVGNTKIFDNNKYLKENLVIKSDDDMNEISEKIRFVKNNKNKILNEYEKMVGGFGYEK